MVSTCTMVSTMQLSRHTAVLHDPNSSPSCCLRTSSSLCIGHRCTSSGRRQSESSRLASGAGAYGTLKLSRCFGRPAKLREREGSVAVRCSGSAEEMETEKPVELPIFPLPLVLFPGAILPPQIFLQTRFLTSSPQSTYTTSKGVFMSDAISMGNVLQRLAGILLGSALLVATLGLGITRPALARSSSVETSSNVLTEELNSDETRIEETALESESTSSKPSKEEEKDPGELVLLSYLERHPEDVKALEGLMYVRLRKGSVAKALETVEKLLALRPDHAPWQFIRAQALDFLGDLDEARRAFEVILERDPFSARALQGLATVMSKGGDGAEMLEMLQRAVQAAMEAEKPKEARNLRILLGQMYTLEGNLQEALAQYQELEKEDPRDFRPYLCQGLVYSLLNQKADAERAFLKYRRRCPKSFPERGYLDDLMIGAKTEARKSQAEERMQPQGKPKPKPLQQPNIVTAIDDNIGLQEE